MERNSPKDEVLLESWYLEPFREFFASPTQITIQLVFACICWIRSVAALQGNRTLRRTTGLCAMYSWELGKRISFSMGTCRRAMPERLHDTALKTLRADIIQRIETALPLLRVNPVLSGCVLLDLQMKYLEITNDIVLTTPVLHAFSHIYSDLHASGLIDEIPFFEDVIRVYEPAFFSPSRAETTRGRFAKSYLASKSLLEASLLAAKKGRKPKGPTNTVFEKIRLLQRPRLYRLLYMRDFSMLPSDARITQTWKHLLGAVTDVCSADLFESRVLSRDVLLLSDELSNLFLYLRERLGRRQKFDELLAGSSSRGRDVVSFDRALENSVVFPLLPRLDTYQGNSSPHEEWGRDFLDDEDYIHDEVLLNAIADPTLSQSLFCRNAAARIARHFAAKPPGFYESAFFTFPPTPDWISTEFTSSDFKDKMSEAEEFQFLMEMMNTRDGPLNGEQVEEFKQRVKARPSVLALSCEGVELSTLLHHAAAGPASDLVLVEWLVLMGALEIEAQRSRENSCEFLVVHCAARRGFGQIVKLILEAGNFRDVDTTTVKTKESLVHIAVRSNNRELFEYLVSLDADMSLKTASGETAWDLANSLEWKQSIKRILDWQKSEEKRIEDIVSQNGNGDEDGKLKQHQEVLERHRDSTRASGTQGIERAPGVAATKCGKKSKTNKKNKKKKNAKTLPADVSEAKSNMRQLFAGNNPESTDNKISVLSIALNKLKHDARTSGQDRDASAKTALEVFEHYIEAMDSIMKAGDFISPTVCLKRTMDAMHVVFLLREFEQQLCGPRPDLCDSYLNRQTISYETKLTVALTPDDNADYAFYFHFAVNVAVSLVLMGMRAEAHRVITLIEKDLLSINDRYEGFRTFVQQYVGVRRMARLEPRLGSSPEAERLFDWFYMRVKTKDGFESPAFNQFRDVVRTLGQSLVFFADSIIAGAVELNHIVHTVLNAASHTGLSIRQEHERIHAEYFDRRL